MYKIKDDINLKDLEDLGFKRVEGVLIPRYYRGRTTFYYNIEISMNIPLYKFNDYRIKHNIFPMYDRVICINRYDVEEILIKDDDNDIYDLIKLNIVEEIKE